jgi:ribosomal protein S24E
MAAMQKNIVDQLTDIFEEKQNGLRIMFRQEIDKRINESYVKTAKVIQELLTMKLHAEGPKQKELLVISAIRNNFGKDIAETLSSDSLGGIKKKAKFNASS